MGSHWRFYGSMCMFDSPKKWTKKMKCHKLRVLNGPIAVKWLRKAVNGHNFTKAIKWKWLRPRAGGMHLHLIHRRRKRRKKSEIKVHHHSKRLDNSQQETHKSSDNKTFSLINKINFYGVFYCNVLNRLFFKRGRFERQRIAPVPFIRFFFFFSFFGKMIHSMKKIQQKWSNWWTEIPWVNQPWNWHPLIYWFIHKRLAC